ncbi:MAG: DUF190 domain-containing protein [Thermocrinis sp.]|jgi:PII-like signaling protein
MGIFLAIAIGVVEIIDCQEKIDQVLPEIAQMVKEGLITIEKVKVIRA